MESGRKADRSGLAAALAECRARRATLLIAKLDRLARSVAFISNLMEGRVDFVVADMPGVNRLTVHVLAVAKVRGTRLGNPRLPPAGTLAAAPAPVAPGGAARMEAAKARAVAAYRDVVEAARVAGARSLGDYAQALQAARVPTPKGGNRWSRPSVARVLRYSMPPAD